MWEALPRSNRSAGKSARDADEDVIDEEAFVALNFAIEDSLGSQQVNESPVEDEP